MVGSSSVTTPTKRTPHCRSNCAIHQRNNWGEQFTERNDEKDFINVDVDVDDNNDRSFDSTIISNKQDQDQDIANSNSDDGNSNSNSNINSNNDNSEGFYDDWKHGNWCWL